MNFLPATIQIKKQNFTFNINTCLSTSIIFLMILSSGSIFFYGFSNAINLSLFLLIGFFAILNIENIKIKFLTRYLIFLSFALPLVLLLFYFQNLTLFNPFLLYLKFTIRLIFLGIFLAVSYSADLDLGKALFRSCKLIVVWALFSFFLQFITNVDIFSFNFGGAGGKTFYYLTYYAHRISQGSPWYRNAGVMWEPGVLQFYANLLVYFALYVYPKKIPSLIAGIVCLLSTFSTTGLICLIILLSGKASFLVKQKKILLLIVLVMGFSIKPIVIDKISSLNNPSIILRLYDLEKAINILSIHPIIGLGPNTENYREFDFVDSYVIKNSKINIDNFWKPNRGLTNSIFELLCHYGIFIGLIYLISMSIQNIVAGNLAFKIVLILTIASEPLATKNLFLFFALSGFFRLKFESYFYQTVVFLTARTNNKLRMTKQ